MNAGKGCDYLLRTVAADDGDRSFATPPPRYITVTDTPPGRWMSSRLPALESTIKSPGNP